jgi:hypothetical protein
LVGGIEVVHVDIGISLVGSCFFLWGQGSCCPSISSILGIASLAIGTEAQDARVIFSQVVLIVRVDGFRGKLRPGSIVAKARCRYNSLRVIAPEIIVMVDGFRGKLRPGSIVLKGGCRYNLSLWLPPIELLLVGVAAICGAIYCTLRSCAFEVVITLEVDARSLHPR